MRFFYLFFTFALFSCSNGSDLLEPDLTMQDKEMNNPSLRTVNDAVKIAEKASSVFYGTKTRATKIKDVINYTSVKTRGEDNPLLYIVNFEDDKGYAVIGADKRINGLIAICEEGNYNGAGSLNPSAEEALEMAAIYASSTIPSIKDSFPDFITRIVEEDTLIYSIIKPRIVTKLGQQWPTGYFCPNGYCGCSITAAAQIMSYYEEPRSYSINYPNADVSFINIDWQDIKIHSGNGLYCFSHCEASEESHFILARLCRQLGYEAGSKYADNGTGTSLNQEPGLFKNTSLNVTERFSYITNSTIDRIHDDGILFMGSKPELGSGPGHAWLIDGYNHYKIKQSIYNGHPTLLDPTGENNKEFIRENILENTYVHINWGWNGNSNGFYYDGIFDTSRYYKLDDENSKGINNYDLSYSKTCFIVSK